MSSSYSPYIFDEFFASGKEEAISPFLTKQSRKWGKNLSLKAAIVSAFFLLLSFLSTFWAPTLSPIFLILVYFLSGTPALIATLEDLRNLEINIDVLMTLAALLSVLIGSSHEGALLLVLFEISGAMEKTVTVKTKSALQTLHKLSPKTAFIVDEEGKVFEKSVKDIPIGAKILVKAGEIVPLDGKILEGSTYVNLVHLTGESTPIPKKAGDEIQAGANNIDGSLLIKVERSNKDSTLSRIIELITKANDSKPKLQRWLDKFGKTYASTIILLTFCFAISLPFLFSIPFLGTEGGIYRALTFLVAASPCALILATPTAYLSAISSCAKKGLIIKGGIILDAVNSCKIIAFDKTGTLTTGKLQVEEFQAFYLDKPICNEKVAISIAAGLERNAHHPIADAINLYASLQDISPYPLKNFKAIPGSGLEGLIELEGEEFQVYIGQPTYVFSKLTEAHWEKNKSKINAIEKIHCLLLIKNTLFVFSFSDEIRKEAFQTLKDLKKKCNLSLVMLTGDHSQNARKVAAELQLDNYFFNLQPQDKLEKIAEISSTHGLAMVGDGMNDAPALARATVGISMGKIGSATAIEASDIVVLQDDLSLLPWIFEKAKMTSRIVKENLFLALGVICLATTPAVLGFVPLWLAVVLHEGGTVLVGLNSLRLLKQK
ncbi:MAG: cation-translocating P-type ATPase [Chlamydiae bacterium]|nr:cation-translocating P-type ATPase [Chlamydiota bacterium]